MSTKIKDLKYYERLNFGISIIDFLYIYCGLTTSNLYTITHKDVKRLLPELKRFSIDYACKNPDLIFTGDIILVKDNKKITIPYYNPLKDSLKQTIDYGEMADPLRKEKVNKSFDITTLSNYELKLKYKLQRHSKNFNKYKICRLIKKELINRNIKGSGRKRILLENMKGEINND